MKSKLDMLLDDDLQYTQMKFDFKPKNKKTNRRTYQVDIHLVDVRAYQNRIGSVRDYISQKSQQISEIEEMIQNLNLKFMKRS